MQPYLDLMRRRVRRAAGQAQRNNRDTTGVRHQRRFRAFTPAAAGSTCILWLN